MKCVKTAGVGKAKILMATSSYQGNDALKLQVAIPLKNSIVSVTPLVQSDKTSLFEAAQDPRIWQCMIQSALGEELFNSYFSGLLSAQKSGQKLPFIIRKAAGQVVGMTRYLNISLEHKRLEIGSTWLHPDVWGTTVNQAGKFLLLSHAFETLEMNRVSLCTDLQNKRSQRAIEKLGARKEGVMRAHMVVQEGRIRDSVLYSITKEQWLSGLRERLFID